MTERRADRAVRDAEDWLKCDYMQSHLSETFTGTIVDVTSFGCFIQLDDIFVQGLLHITALPDDYYVYDKTAHLLRGRSTQNVYRLADKIEVTVVNVNLDERQIDFVCA